MLNVRFSRACSIDELRAASNRTSVRVSDGANLGVFACEQRRMRLSATFIRPCAQCDPMAHSPPIHAATARAGAEIGR